VLDHHGVVEQPHATKVVPAAQQAAVGGPARAEEGERMVMGRRAGYLRLGIPINNRDVPNRDRRRLGYGDVWWGVGQEVMGG
jgi:hypothetical protein